MIKKKVSLLRAGEAKFSVAMSMTLQYVFSRAFVDALYAVVGVRDAYRYHTAQEGLSIHVFHRPNSAPTDNDLTTYAPDHTTSWKSPQGACAQGFQPIRGTDRPELPQIALQSPPLGDGMFGRVYVASNLTPKQSCPESVSFIQLMKTRFPRLVWRPPQITLD